MIDLGAIVWNCLVWGSSVVSVPWMLVRPSVLLDVFPASYLGWGPSADGD
jgi:hypothetical protein